MTLLTTKDLQAMMNVDKSTIYRMAEDGRIPAVKVGRQWRFPADRIAEMLGDLAGPELSTVGADRRGAAAATDLAALLDPEAAQAITDLVGDLFGVMAVLTDMAGTPLTEVANPCGYFDVIRRQPGAVERCTAGWRELGADLGLEPRFIPSHFGFLCARSFIRVGSNLVGMLIVGGVKPSRWPPPVDRLTAAADEAGVPVEALAERVEDLYYLDDSHQRWVLGLLPRLSDLISRLAAARSQLLDKLDAIAVLAGRQVANQRSTV